MVGQADTAGETNEAFVVLGNGVVKLNRTEPFCAGQSVKKGILNLPHQMQTCQGEFSLFLTAA